LTCLLVDGDKLELLLQVAQVIQVEGEGVHADDVCVRACVRDVCVHKCIERKCQYFF
jgi:hypothetical protein